MNYDPKKKQFEEKAKEALFHKRLSDLRTQNAQFPWTVMGELPQLEIPAAESKLFADREVEGPEISDADLARKAMLDLTSLSSSFGSFYKRLHYEIKRARRYRRDLSVVLVAIDNLDNLGLQLGPDIKRAIIEESAQMLLSCIRDTDVPGRCREDCFGIILPETPVDGAEIAAERIRTKMEQYIVPNTWSSSTQLTVSVGVASFPINGETVEELFAQGAEALMYTVKKGGNAVNFAGRF
jgi:diguanylate cyclase (GGDEF)-like protein